jgi:hypothetical protein
VLIDHNYIHDITWDCSTNPDPSCANDFNCPANTKVCNHADGSQIFGAKTMTISNNRYYNAGGQNIFLQTVHGGLFSNLTFINNMVSITAGKGVTNSVSLSGPGVGVVSGYVKFINNTFQKGLVIYDVLQRNRVLAPGTEVVLVGNIFGVVGPDNGAPRCNWIASDGSQIKPFYSHNLIGNKQCSPTDRQGKATFVSADSYHPDLHLARGSLGIGGGDMRRATQMDIDRQLRPAHSAPDMGADQREPALIQRGRGLGAVRLGQSETAVVGFYGAPRAVKRLRVAGGEVRIATYRLHGGMVWVAYSGEQVVGIGTNSFFYELGPIRVGVKLHSLGTMRWSSCRSAYGSGTGQNRIYFAPAGGRKGGKVASIWLLGRRTAECWTHHH